jgi:alkylation response protein AidB-like acyl-CoA dehydrogenase
MQLLIDGWAGRPGEIDELVRLARVIADTIEPEAARVDQEGNFPWKGLRALADANLGCLLVPEELGGQNTPTSVYATALARIAAACGSTSTVYMTQLHCAHPILLAGRPDQRERWIPALCAAEAVGAIALTEPEAGSDVASLRTTARRDGDAYRINGSKIFISNGDVADVIVLFASVDTALGRGGITAFLIETDGLAGFEAGKPMHKLGQKGASTVALSFDDCRIPADAVLGDEGGGYPLLLKSVLKSRISAAAQGVGFAMGAFEATVRYCAEHDMLSGRNRAAQDVQFELAALRSEVLAAHSMLHAVADLADAGGDPTTAVSMAKLHCTTLGVRVAARCVEILGEDGDRVDLGVERCLRDAKIAEIYDGTNQVQSMLVARDLRLAAESAAVLRIDSA